MMLADKIRQLTAAARRRRRRSRSRSRSRRSRSRRCRKRMRRSSRRMRKRREECLHHFLTPMYVSPGSNVIENIALLEENYKYYL